MIHLMNESLNYQLNKAGLTRIKEIMEVMPRTKHGKFLIDQSTVGLHMTGSRRLNLEHAYVYAKILKVHPWRILDDYVCRYPVVGNYNPNTGFVTNRGKFQNDYLVCSNDLQYIPNTLVILSKSCKIAYIYNEGVFLNEDNFNSAEPQRCILETKEGEILGFVNHCDFKKQLAQFVLPSCIKQWRAETIKYSNIRPINEILNLNTVSDLTGIVEHTFEKPKQYY